MEETIPAAPADIKPIKTWREWWPGKIGVDRTGNLSGCRSKVFIGGNWNTASALLNSFFEDNPGLLSAEITPIPAAVDGTVGFHLLYTKYTSEEEIQAFNRVEAKARELLDLEDADAAKQRALQEELQAKQQKTFQDRALAEQKELNRLAELGRVHQNTCAKKKKESK